MQSITRFVEARLKLVVNRQKSRAAALSACAFLGFQIRRGRIVWTEKARTRFKERIQAITSRSRGVSTYCMLSELRRYVVGWLNYFGISQAYREIPAMDQWLRRRVRMYYWKQWKRARGRRRNLIRWASTRRRFTRPRAVIGKLVDGRHQHCAARAGQSLVTERGVPSVRQQWIEMHYGKQENERFNPENAPRLSRFDRFR